jgi:hypothetical protein
MEAEAEAVVHDRSRLRLIKMTPPFQDRGGGLARRSHCRAYWSASRTPQANDAVQGIADRRHASIASCIRGDARCSRGARNGLARSGEDVAGAKAKLTLTFNIARGIEKGP